jgi:Zn-dependent protease/CBS domain-containing protein
VPSTDHAKRAPPAAAALGRRPANDEGPIHSSVTLGRIAGVEIGLNWSWLIVVALIVWSLADAAFPASNPGLATGTYVAMAAVAAVAFFASILLHELGHAVQARHEGMEIGGITLWVFGGVARFKGMFPSAGAEFRVAVAGPVVSALLGTLFLAIAAALRLAPAVDGVLTWLGFINLMLLGFNLLPALPLDGGRILRSALWARRGDLASATFAAGRVSAAIGRGMIGGGIALLLFVGAVGGLWLALIGWFVLQAGGMETRLVAAQQALAGVRVSDLMSRAPSVLAVNMTLAEAVRRELSRAPHAIYPVLDEGATVGVIALSTVAALPREPRQTTRVGDAMIPIDRALVLDADDQLADALVALAQTHLGRAVVMDRGSLVGVLAASDVQRALQLRSGFGARARHA